MKNKFNLESKISRGPFIFYGICFVAISSFFKSLIDYTDNLNVLLISLLLGTFFFILTFYIIALRLKDLNRPAWHYFLLAIPIYNIYLTFLLFFKKGEEI